MILQSLAWLDVDEPGVVVEVEVLAVIAEIEA